MVIPKRTEEKEGILFLKMSIDTEIRTVKMLEEKTDQNQEKRIENIQTLEAMKIGIKMVPIGDGKNPADPPNNPENPREIRTGEEKSLQQSRKNNYAELQKLNMPYIQSKQIIFYID